MAAKAKKGGATQKAAPAEGNGKTKAKAKAKAVESEEGMVSLADLASEFKLSPQRARQKLRAANLARERGSRWKWADGSKDLAAARKALQAAEPAE